VRPFLFQSPHGLIRKDAAEVRALKVANNDLVGFKTHLEAEWFEPFHYGTGLRSSLVRRILRLTLEISRPLEAIGLAVIVTRSKPTS